MKENCWQYKACGREPGGARVREFGVCPACVEYRLNGVHGGTNGGRSCWVVAGTSCHDVLGSSENRSETCTGCDFYRAVKEEEKHFIFSGTLLTNFMQ